MTDQVVIVVGLGEVGRPLLKILGRSYTCIAVDLAPVDVKERCLALHICYPFQIADFISTTVSYILKYRPELVIINSTVAPGTTRAVQALVPDIPVTYSPVRGKHARMEADILRYKKFVSGFSANATLAAAQHFRTAGLQTDVFRTPELAEVSKLLETTYLGIIVAWAQETERIARRFGGSFDEVSAFTEEIDFLPRDIFPGRIGGHCVMPNIAILQENVQSPFLDVITESNRIKELECEPKGLEERSFR